MDAEQTVDTMDKTKDSFRAVEAAQPGAAGLRQLLSERGVQVRYRAIWVLKGYGGDRMGGVAGLAGLRQLLLVAGRRPLAMRQRGR